MTAAERRDVNIANAEPVEEVVPQRPVGLRRDVAVGRGHKPHVAAHTSVTAHGEDFLCLDDPKKLRLVLVVELADFVEEERALIRQADQIGRAACSERGCSTCRARWSPYQ